MVQDPLSLIDALMVALSGFVIVFIMLALLWGIIAVVSRAVSSVEHRPAAAPARRPCLHPPLPHRQLPRPRRPSLRRRLCWKASTRRKRLASWRLSAMRRGFRSISLCSNPLRRFKGEANDEIYGYAERKTV